MTTLEKITSLNWFDFLRKIKEILLGLSAEKIEEAPIDGTQYARQDGEWSEVTGGGGGATNLSYTVSPTDGTVNSDTGTDATLPLADGTNSGLMSPADYTKLTTYNTPVSASVLGIVNNTSLQELGGADKLIHGIRVGTGSSTGIDNTVFGVNSQGLATSGTENSSFGFESLKAVTTGSYNSAFGWGALQKITTGSTNSAFGYRALQNNTADSNVAFGIVALQANTTGTHNSALGSYTLYKNITGIDNTGVGYAALKSVIDGNYNTTVGSLSGSYTLGSNNTAMGYIALNTNASTPTNNTGSQNTAIGSRTGRYVTTGSGNVLIYATSTDGGGSGSSITTGSNNLIISPNDNIPGSGVTTGSGNIVLGRVTGLSSSLANTVVIADGVGTQRFVSNSSNLSTLPNQTNALIEADASGKAIITKGYINNIGAVDNATTTTLTALQLTTAYPNALIGFRVHCLLISGGALIYHKTSTGWAQSSITVVV